MENSVLERLVEHILLELLEAQNASNEASAKLAESYLNPKKESTIPNLEFFPVPNSSIKSFDFELKFALRDISVVLTDSAISEINELIIEIWEYFLENLVNNNAILERRKESLSKSPPILNISALESKAKTKASASKSDTIASFLEKEILLKMIEKLPRRSRKNKSAIAKSMNGFDLRQKINEILFRSKNEQTLPLPDVKAVFDVGQLNNASGEIICSINVHVEMRNFDSAYYNDIGKENEAPVKKRILTLKD